MPSFTTYHLSARAVRSDSTAKRIMTPVMAGVTSARHR